MPRRRELKGVAYDVLEAFVSRYNDVCGYWGMGKLYRHAVSNGVLAVEIDLLQPGTVPPSDEFDAIIRQYAERLVKNCAKKHIPPSWVCGARIFISYDPDSQGQPVPFWPTVGDVFDCRLEIEDDLGRKRIAQRKGRCWPHDPHREWRSNRVARF